MKKAEKSLVLKKLAFSSSSYPRLNSPSSSLTACPLHCSPSGNGTSVYLVVLPRKMEASFDSSFPSCLIPIKSPSQFNFPPKYLFNPSPGHHSHLNSAVFITAALWLCPSPAFFLPEASHLDAVQLQVLWWTPVFLGM